MEAAIWSLKKGNFTNRREEKLRIGDDGKILFVHLGYAPKGITRTLKRNSQTNKKNYPN